MTERMERKLLDLKARQEAGEHMSCPCCGKDRMKEPVHTNALSRVADVYVCDDCGTAEAMLAFMKQQYPLTCWAAFQPQRPPADFKARPAHEVMGIVLHTQSEDLQRIFLLCQEDPENAEWHRLEAFESCPGLSELWPQPFQAKFRAADGAVLVRFKSGPDGGIRVAANVVDS